MQMGGVKLSLFDVSVPETPIELDQTSVGTTGRYSPTLHQLLAYATPATRIRYTSYLHTLH